jgi:hypothetical protein
VTKIGWTGTMRRSRTPARWVCGRKRTASPSSMILRSGSLISSDWKWSA